MAARRNVVVAKPEPECDVAVLGGGPAGAAAARLLALQGHRVALLTRPAPGPPLAESLTPSCGKLLERIGVLDAMNGAGFIRSTGHTVRWGSGDERVERFAGGGLGWQVVRDALDRVLLRRAKEGGAQVHRHASVRAVSELAGGALRVSYEERGRSRQLVARWVVDCTGRTGLMARAGSGRAPKGPRTIALVGLWERRPHWNMADESHTLVESYDGGWAWSVPVSRTRRQVTVMLDPSRTSVAHGSRLRLTYREELARTTMIQALTEHARFLGSPWARDASSYECDSAAQGRVLLVGDAASFVDPLSSYGVKKALASAWLAAVVIHSALSEPAIEAAAVGLFESRERAMAAGLRRQLDELAREAASAHTAGFWGDRQGGDAMDSAGDPDLVALREDASVRSAFDAIRARPTLQVRASRNVTRAKRALVAGDRVTLADHLIVKAFPTGIRYIRSVDLIVLAALAPAHSDVATLFDAYNASAPPVAIEDLLGALAVLIGKGVLGFVS